MSQSQKSASSEKSESGPTELDSLSESEGRKTTITVVHAGYGCDTGCCGHVIKAEWADGTEDEEFEFTHPWRERGEEDRLAWAKKWVAEKFGADHVADLDWENCYVTADC